MTGFIKGLFRSKPKAEAVEPTQERQSQKQPAPRREVAPKPRRSNGSRAEAYYLNTDDAKTYGDIDFMRSAKSTRRTFPKAKDGSTPEFVQKVSSLEKASDQGLIPSALNAPASQSSIEDTLKVVERRKADSSMDAFRNMAREIRKK